MRKTEATPMADSWFYYAGGDSKGPVDTATLQTLARSGRIFPQTPILKMGTTDWVIASQVPGLFDEPSTPTPSGAIKALANVAQKLGSGPVIHRGPSEAAGKPGGGWAATALILCAIGGLFGVGLAAYLLNKGGGVDKDPAVKKPADPGRNGDALDPATIAADTKLVPRRGAGEPFADVPDARNPDDPKLRTEVRKPEPGLSELLKPFEKDPPETAVEKPIEKPTKTIDKPKAKTDLPDEPIAKAEPKVPTEPTTKEPVVKSVEPPTKTDPPATKTDPPATKVITPEDEKRAANLYRDIFGAESDRAAKGSPAEKYAFAQKLSKAATVASDDAALGRLLREKTAEFAKADPAGYDLAVNTLRELAPTAKDKPAVFEQVWEIEEKTLKAVKAAERAKVALDMINTACELADAYLDAHRPDKALEAVGKAKSMHKGYLGTRKDIGQELAVYEGFLNRRSAAHAKYDAAQKTLRTAPKDGAANTTVGLYYLLWEDRPPAEAAAYLSRSSDPAYSRLAGVLTAPEAKAVELADAYRAAGQAAGSKEDQTSLLLRAKEQYQAVIDKEPMHADAVRIKLILAQLPSDAATETFADAPRFTADAGAVAKTDPGTKADPKTKAALEPLSASTATGRYQIKSGGGTTLMYVQLLDAGVGFADRGANRAFNWQVRAPDTLVISFAGRAESFRRTAANTFVSPSSGQVMVKLP
jgi:hypothetical protein